MSNEVKVTKVKDATKTPAFMVRVEKSSHSSDTWEATPNARNYYLVPGLFEHAMAQHQERKAKLLEVWRSIEAELEAIGN